MSKLKITKLWLLTGNKRGYDTFDSCVVAADTEEEARQISPAYYKKFGYDSTWATTPEDVVVEYLGRTEREIKGVVLSSFNAG